jgi:ADP-heptose:LPS heptosyltransferase
LAGETDITTLKGIISAADLVVSGSTGPIHIAAAVGTFAVGIYPPESALSATRWGPRGSANKLFVPPVHALRGNMQQAMDLIDLDEVCGFIEGRLSADNKSNVGRKTSG